MGFKKKIFFLFKIMQKQHINSFAKGDLYFSCCGKWIDIAKKGCGKGQGDKYEGVFAKYKKKNSRKPLQHYKALFKKDLKVEKEGEYLLFKRISSLYIPAICFYSVDSKTALDYLPDDEKNRINNIINGSNNEEIIIDDFPFVISKEYLSEFNMDSELIDAVIIQPRKLVNQLTSKGALCKKVTYIDKSSEFDIFKDGLYKESFPDLNLNEAYNKHIEILFKDKRDYSHQCEYRAILFNEKLSGINRGKTLHLDDLSNLDITSLVGEPVNATGIDIISYAKDSTDIRGRATLAKI